MLSALATPSSEMLGDEDGSGMHSCDLPVKMRCNRDRMAHGVSLSLLGGMPVMSFSYAWLISLCSIR